MMKVNTLIKKLEEIRDTEFDGNGAVEVLVLKNFPGSEFHYFKFTSKYKTAYEVREVGLVSGADRLDESTAIIIG